MDIKEEMWNKVVNLIETMTDKKPKDINAILFLIGVQEVGSGIKTYSKEQKQDLIHVGTTAILCVNGYYTKDYVDDDGWPHFTLVKKLPHGKIGEQERFLRGEIISYFENSGLI